MSAFVGIDLGTSYSCIAYIDNTGRPQVIPNKDGENITPSVVAIQEFDGKEVVEVGTWAYETWGFDKTKAHARFKRQMHETDLEIQLGKNTYSPSDLSSFVLKKLVQDAKDQLGEIEEVVISIPANFSNEAREATLRAGDLAGLKVNFIVNEPTAAALYYSFLNQEALDGIYAVYDLGGGTFDFSVIEVKHNEVKVLNSDGIQKCGGDDFDRLLYDLIVDKYYEKSQDEINDLDFNLTHAEKAKRSLTSKEKALVKVGKEIIEITREEFNEAISSLVLQTKVTVEKTINDSGVDFSDVLEVYMVGGSTRVPLVQETIASIFNKQPVQTVNPDEVVALGAALYAGIRGDQTKLNEAGKMSLSKIRVQDISNKCFGTVVLNLDYEQVNSTLIYKGDEIPTSYTSTYFIINNLQETVRVQITESIVPEENIDFVRIIWEGDLELSNPKEVLAGDQIEVTYSYDSNQVMHCEFTEKRSGVSKKVKLDMKKFSKSNSVEDIEVI